MDLIANILKRIILETKERQKHFYEYVPSIIYYINFMFNQDYFIPDQNYLISCISILFDLIDVYTEEALNSLENNTFRRINFFIVKSGDGELISLNEALENFQRCTNYKLQLNQDDLFKY